jgi:hypothetical protein
VRKLELRETQERKKKYKNQNSFFYCILIFYNVANTCSNQILRKCISYKANSTICSSTNGLCILIRISGQYRTLATILKDTYSILTKSACYGSRPFMDNNTHNCCNSHHSTVAQVSVCLNLHRTICDIRCTSRRYECLQSIAASNL